MPNTRLRWTDAVLTLAVFAGALAWFAAQPHNLGPADEAFLLADAVRIGNGERLYRDIFWLAMPLAHWGLVAVFSLFGASLATAKTAMAVVNSATAAMSVAGARSLGVRAPIALLPALAFLALVQPVWPHVSPHWLVTSLIMALLLLVAAPGALERPRRLFGAGLALGLLAGVHQQKAPALTVGLVLAIAIACWVRRDAAAPRWWARVGVLAAGGALIMVPVLATLLATVDLQRLLDDTVRFPLTGYRSFHTDVGWGRVGILNAALAAYTWPPLLRFLPLLLPVAGAVAAIGCRRGWPRGRVVQWSAAMLVCASGLGAIGYNADFIHIAYVTPPLLVLGALLLDTAIAALAGRRRAAVAAVAAAALAAALGLQLYRNAQRMRAEYGIRVDTAFGPVDFHAPSEVALNARIRELLDQAPSRELFIYPCYASLYLTAGAHNPTRHQILLPTLSWPSYFAEVQQALAARPALVIVMGRPPANDPFVTALAEHYAPFDGGEGWTAYRWRH